VSKNYCTVKNWLLKMPHLLDVQLHIHSYLLTKMTTKPAWHSGHRVCLQNWRSHVRIPLGCKVF
jgi:hypothetical protein